MTILGRRHALLGLSATLAGCVSTDGPAAVTQSNADASYQQKLRRVVVAISAHSDKATKVENQAFLRVEELKQSFEAKWPAIGIAVDVISLDGVADRDQAILDADARFRAGQWLALQPSWIRTLAPEAVKEYGIAASLFDASTKKRIWRAETAMKDFWRFSGYDLVIKMGRQTAADHYVDSLTEKLRADGLI
jgi:hypothetical protein